MEITEINMLSDFEAGVKCLQNPSFLCRFFSFPVIDKVPQVYSFWKWGALIFAIFASFSSIIKRIKLIFVHFRTLNPSTHHKEEIVEFSEDDDISLTSSDDEQEEGEGNSPTTSSRGQHRVDEDLRAKVSRLSFGNQRQSGHLRQRRGRNNGSSWSEFSGKSVVKLWDSLGLSLDFDEDLFNYDPKSVVSTWDFDQERKTRNFSAGMGSITAAAPIAPSTVFLTAEDNRNGEGVILGGYDPRMRRSVPAFYAEWSSTAAEKAAGASTGGIAKVYVRDDVSGLVTVGDVRTVRRPLESVRESDGDTWWDADAVIVDESR